MVMTDVEVQQCLQTVFDKQAHKHVSACALLAHGIEADIFAFTLQTEEIKKQNLVLRLYAGEGIADKVVREFDAMRRLREVGYPVPRVLVFGNEESPFGRPFIVMEQIDGVPLASAYGSVSKERQQALQEGHWQLMAQLHALEEKAIIPDSPLADSDNTHQAMYNELSTLSDWLDNLEGKEPLSLRSVLSWLYDHHTTVSCEPLSVIHGDFHRNNILVRTDGALCVIDWSNVRLGDYRMDVAWTQLIAAVAGWDTGDTALLHYEKWAGKAVSGLEYFEVLVCLRLLLSTLNSLHFGSARQGLRPEAEEQLRRDATPMRFAASQLQQRTGVNTDDFEKFLKTLLSANPTATS